MQKLLSTISSAKSYFFTAIHVEHKNSEVTVLLKKSYYVLFYFYRADMGVKEFFQTQLNRIRLKYFSRTL